MKKIYPTITVLTLATGTLLDPAKGSLKRLHNLIGDITGKDPLSFVNKPESLALLQKSATKQLKLSHPELKGISVPADGETLTDLQPWYDELIRYKGFGHTFTVVVAANFAYANPPSEQALTAEA